MLDCLDLINVHGRIAVITFHSLEDRLCKQIFKDVSSLKDVPRGLPIIPDEMQPEFELVNRKAMVPSARELNENRRSHSAKLRVLERKRCQ